MVIGSFEPTMVLAVLPEIMLVVLAGIILVLDATWKPENKRKLGWLTASGLLVAMIVSFLFSAPQGRGG